MYSGSSDNDLVCSLWFWVLIICVKLHDFARWIWSWHVLVDGCSWILERLEVRLEISCWKDHVLEWWKFLVERLRSLHLLWTWVHIWTWEEIVLGESIWDLVYLNGSFSFPTLSSLNRKWSDKYFPCYFRFILFYALISHGYESWERIIGSGSMLYFAVVCRSLWLFFVLYVCIIRHLFM